MADKIDSARRKVLDAWRAYKERQAAYDAGLVGWACGPSADLLKALQTTRDEVDTAKKDLDERIREFNELVGEE